MKCDDILIEIYTEELPPKILLTLALAFSGGVREQLNQLGFSFDEVKYFVTPCRLAVWVKECSYQQEDQVIERKGPSKQAAYDANGNPSQASIGFARSLGVSPKDLIVIKNQQGEWMGYQQKISGKTLLELLPNIVNQVILSLPIKKRMRWSDLDVQFVRPVHSVILLYGKKVIAAQILGCQTNRLTHGHPFLTKKPLSIPNASQYEKILTQGYVMADFDKRVQHIRKSAAAIIRKTCGNQAEVLMTDEALLHEVAGLVEWPHALCGQFDKAFLQLPKEVLIASMQDHQRYFPVVDKKNNLLPYFVTMSNLDGRSGKHILHGNERVLRARLKDAAFFYEVDKKERLENRVDRLKGMVFQAKLGTLYDKSERLSKMAAFIAEKMGQDVVLAKRIGLLAKTDLTTNMVGEFPELQGVMGYYYAKSDGEPEEIATALKEQYLPRFAGDRLPESTFGRILALADKIDLLVGSFGIHEIPSGDKDPYGLRRATLGLLRILIENHMHLDLNALIEFTVFCYAAHFTNPDCVSPLRRFIEDRMRSFYLDQGVSADIFAAVAAMPMTDPYDRHRRILAVKAFKTLHEAESLSIANKRVSNILNQYSHSIDAKDIDASFFEHTAERELFLQLEKKSKVVTRLYQSGKYDEVLRELAGLRKPIDDFFDQVMVMTDNKQQRENRLLLLGRLRALFLKIADIALLQ